MKSSFGKGANWRVTRLSGGCQISPFCLSVALLVIAVPSHAQVSPCGHVPISDCGKASSATYCPVYTCYLKAPFWRTVSAMGGQNVNPSGLAVFNNGTHGPGIISELVGYAMILAALYDDKATFDQLSATVQAGIALRTRKSAGLMMRKLSVTKSQRIAQFFGTSSRRKCRTARQKSL